jgi:hypothetical protein
MKKIILLVLSLVLLISISLPLPAMAKTQWDLEGWRVAQGKWMDGLLWTYYECSWVPYRLVATKYDGVDKDISIQHDFLDADGHYGIDGARNFFIGPPTGRTDTPASITPVYYDGGPVFHVVSPPDVVPVPNGAILEFTIIIDDTSPLIGTDFAIYWEAHCAKTNSLDKTFGNFIEFGSSFWSGASLHAHTSVTGHQDVPIKTPPQVVAEPTIDVEKYVGIACCSCCGCSCPTDPAAWDDADVTGPDIELGGYVCFKFVVTNNSDVILSNITLIDDVYGSISIPTGPLDVGDSFEAVIGPYQVTAVGQHTNTAEATGYYGGTTCWDTDVANYVGVEPPCG